MNFDLSSLAASFVYGTFGIYIFKHGRKQANGPIVALGVALMIYPYFFENPYLVWGVGAVLSERAYKVMQR